MIFVRVHAKLIVNDAVEASASYLLPASGLQNLELVEKLKLLILARYGTAA